MKNFRTIAIVALLALAAWAGIGMWKGFPPFDSRQQPESVKEETKPFPEKAPFLYSRRSLSGMCDEYGLETKGIVRELELLGIDAKPEWSIKRIADENDMEPRSVFDVIRQIHAE